MCLAVPARVIETRSDEAVVDLQGNRLRVGTMLTPEVGIGDWVLVHAGFAITTLDERDAMETWEYLRAMSDQESDDERPSGSGFENAHDGPSDAAR